MPSMQRMAKSVRSERGLLLNKRRLRKGYKVVYSSGSKLVSPSAPYGAIVVYEKGKTTKPPGEDYGALGVFEKLEDAYAYIDACNLALACCQVWEVKYEVSVDRRYFKIPWKDVFYIPRNIPLGDYAESITLIRRVR